MNYKIRNDIVQGTEEWLILKRDKIRLTGTLAEYLLKHGKKATLIEASKRQQASLKYSGPVSKYAKWGCDNEPKARELLSKKLGVQFEETGIIESLEYEDCGVSLDGCTFKDKDKTEIDLVCEIKCYQMKHHEKVLEDGPDQSVMCQMQWEMFITGAKECYYTGYCPLYLDETLTDDGKRHPEKVLYIKKIKASKDYQNAFIEALNK